MGANELIEKLEKIDGQEVEIQLVENGVTKDLLKIEKVFLSTDGEILIRVKRD